VRQSDAGLKEYQMIKFAYMINRLDGMRFEDFVDYHRNRHAPLFKSIPEAQRYVRRYAISHPVAAPNQPVPAYDGLTEIWFDSLADYEAFFTSNNYLEKVRPDETWFTLEGVMVTDELVVIE
jgi:uncharacterized protein (TIGR02118 family)